MTTSNLTEQIKRILESRI